jgi:hypothetical protein
LNQSESYSDDDDDYMILISMRHTVQVPEITKSWKTQELTNIINDVPPGSFLYSLNASVE